MEKENASHERLFDIFLEGEVIDLCVPSSDSWVLDQWYRWFNDSRVNQYLDQGVFPNTIEKQQAFYQALVEKEDRIALLIKPKSKDYFVGVANLSYINIKQRQCDFAMVIGKQDKSYDSIYYAIEAKCMMTEHAFENLGVERINSTQAIDLIKWQRWQFLFGYQIEGILRNKYRRGNKVYDVMASSCLLEDYLKIKEMRNGQFWPGKKKMFELLKSVSKETSIDKLDRWLLNEKERFWKALKLDISGASDD
jgi:RimJ/RimL family protein N-acetyltransferase